MRPGDSFLEQPVRSLQTMLRVIAEDDPRLPSVVPDGIYGTGTLSSVSAFQRLYSLPVTGVVDEETWNTIVSVYEPALVRIGKAEPIEILLEPNAVFRIGDSNAYIYLLQSILTQLSKDNQSIVKPEHNGVLDDATGQALAAFQLLAGLPPTGELDRITWKYLAKQFTLSANREAAGKEY